MTDLATSNAKKIQALLGDFRPKVGMILGSGLGGLVERMNVIARIAYHECEGLFTSTVIGHKGEFVFGFLDKVPVMCMNGRVHLYEGATPLQLLTPIRMMKALGCVSLLLTNSSGSLRSDWLPGTIVLIKDQLNFTGVSVLAGPNQEQYGPRFVSMENAYDIELRSYVHQSAKALNLPLKEGIYCGVMGPQYETPAEIRMYGQLGGEMVGMSTIHEVIAARHAGLKVVGLTLITNLGAGLSENQVNHKEVIEMAALAGGKLAGLLQHVFEHHGPALIL